MVVADSAPQLMECPEEEFTGEVKEINRNMEEEL